MHPDSATALTPSPLLTLHDIMTYIYILSQQDAVQQILQNPCTHSLLPSTEYFFRSSTLQRVAQCTTYVPTNDDLMQYRLRRGPLHHISEAEVRVKNSQFAVYDMNCDLDSVTNSCSKWMHCFDDVTSMVFVASLVSYSETILVDPEQHDLNRFKMKIALDVLIDTVGEDTVELIMSFLDDPKEGTNAMAEGIKLFGEVVNNKWFGQQPAILIMNKKDLLQQRIVDDEECYKFIRCFPEYNGIVNYAECTQHIQSMFIQQNRNEDRHIYHHLVSAKRDTDISQRLFNTVQSIVLEQCLRMGNHI